MSNTIVRARIDEHLKEEAAAVLAAMGLTVSDAFRLMMVRIAQEKALPFDPLVPNTETIEAMKEARRGGLPRHKTVDALLKGLNGGEHYPLPPGLPAREIGQARQKTRGIAPTCL